MILKVNPNKRIKLCNLKNGSLFYHNGTYALKSEYRTDKGAIEAYILGTGEFFWGGTHDAKEQSNLLVYQVVIE